MTDSEHPLAGELDRDVGTAEAVRRVFDRLPVAITTTTGKEKRFVVASALHRAMSERAGYIGQPLLTVFPELADDATELMMNLAYSSGTTQRLKEWPVLIPDPAGGPKRRVYLDLVMTPFLSPDGEIELDAMVWDVTEFVEQRLKAEERAAQSEEKLQKSRQIVMELQSALLPSGVPLLPGLELAAVYLLAESEATAGGDWFDAIALPDGRVALVVGDVVGHGVSASALMGQLRAVLRDRLSTEGLPEALAAVDRMASSLPGASASTACVVVLDTSTGDLVYCTAGHPAPLVADARGGTRYLPLTGGSPLGVGGTFPTLGDQLDLGDLLLIMSDGILERPKRDHSRSLREVADSVGRFYTERVTPEGSVAAEAVCVGSTELLVRYTGYNDDITMLSARRVPRVRPLNVQLPARIDSVTESQRLLEEWLRHLGAPKLPGMLLDVAVTELVTNAVLHAYRDGRGGEVRMTGVLNDEGTLELTVEDDGRWVVPSDRGERVSGLEMAGDLVDALHLETSEHGTTARISVALTRPARLLHQTLAPHLTEPAPRGSSTLLIVGQDGDGERRIVLDGPLDITTVEALRQEILAPRATPAPSLVLDLDRLTMLASTGVALMFESRRHEVEQGRSLQLIAGPGTLADQVLTLVGLSHEAG